MAHVHSHFKVKFSFGDSFGLYGSLFNSDLRLTCMIGNLFQFNKFIPG